MHQMAGNDITQLGSTPTQQSFYSSMIPSSMSRWFSSIPDDDDDQPSSYVAPQTPTTNVPSFTPSPSPVPPVAPSPAPTPDKIITPTPPPTMAQQQAPEPYSGPNPIVSNALVPITPEKTKEYVKPPDAPMKLPQKRPDVTPIRKLEIAPPSNSNVTEPNITSTETNVTSSESNASSTALVNPTYDEFKEGRKEYKKEEAYGEEALNEATMEVLQKGADTAKKIIGTVADTGYNVLDTGYSIADMVVRTGVTGVKNAAETVVQGSVKNFQNAVSGIQNTVSGIQGSMSSTEERLAKIRNEQLAPKEDYVVKTPLQAAVAEESNLIPPESKITSARPKIAGSSVSGNIMAAATSLTKKAQESLEQPVTNYENLQGGDKIMADLRNAYQTFYN